MHSALEKGLFVLSVAVLAFLLGFAVRWHGWFPNSLLEQASRQATALLGPWSLPNDALQDRAYDRRGVRSPQPARMQPGLTLVTSFWAWGEADTPTPGAKLIDAEGRTVHAWHPERGVLFEAAHLRNENPRKADFDGSYLFPNGDLLLVLEYIGAVRVNSCGEVLWRLKAGIHHYLSRAEDGSFWMAGTSAERRTATDQYADGFPGIETPVWLDQILNVTADGTVRRRINVLDVLYQNDLERHVVKGLSSQAESVPPDVVHLNDVEPLPAAMADEYPLFEAGDLVVSLRRPSLVFVFDPATGTVKWHTTHPFLHQHDPDFTGNGWIGVFDNNYDLTERGTMLGGSRIVAVQPHTDSTRVRFPTDRSDPFYTSVQGQWQQLANGNLLLAERDAGRVVEVAPDGRTVWEWVHPYPSASKVPIVTGAHRYDLTRKAVASWACSPTDAPPATPN